MAATATAAATPASRSGFHARSLLNRLNHDLEAASIDIQHQQLARGTAYLPVLAHASNAILTRLETAR